MSTLAHFSRTPLSRVFDLYAQSARYSLVPSERGKGYGTEALEIMVDYLFLSKDIMRIQAQTDQRNAVSQKILRKQGSRRREYFKNFFMKGEWADDYICSIIREEWKAPKILTETARE